MLTAILNNQIIHVHDFTPKYLKKYSENKQLTCPECGDFILFKEYQNKQSHFSHFNSDCTYPFREPESIEHETGKIKIYQWLSDVFTPVDVNIERKITETNQRSDTFIESIRTAIEFQCSPIRASTWKTRCDLYESASVKNIWILGYSMHKYANPTNPFVHKTNELEQSILEKYGKIIYYDVLTDHFIFLYPEATQKQGVLGKEYFFKRREVFLNEDMITNKYEVFLFYQRKRKDFLEKTIVQAKETDDFIKKLKSQVDADKVLATKKQINYIQFLLRKNQKTIPYKLHGLLKDEASELISELKKTTV